MIPRFRHRRRRAVAAVLSTGVLAVAAPTAVAATFEDLHSTDAGDAGAAVQRSIAANSEAGDLRSPDARDAALAAQPQPQSGAGYSDLRSPDARDAALGTTTGSQPASDPAPVATRTVIAVEESGSQTLAIVFSAIALAIALLAIGFTALGRRPRPRWSAS